MAKGVKRAPTCEQLEEAFAHNCVVLCRAEGRAYAAWNHGGVRHELGVTNGDWLSQLKRLWAAFDVWREVAKPEPSEGS